MRDYKKDSPEILEIMEEEVGPATHYKSVPKVSFEKYKNILPDALLLIWQTVGWSTWGNGLFWTVNPADR